MNYIVAEDYKKCGICGKETNIVDINYEMRLCSEECCNKMDETYFEYLKKYEGVDLL